MGAGGLVEILSQCDVPPCWSGPTSCLGHVGTSGRASPDQPSENLKEMCVHFALAQPNVRPAQTWLCLE